MLKYLAYATGAKAFSLTPGTKRAYRRLGNVALERTRIASGITPQYVDRAVRLVERCDAHSVLQPGDRVLELGTGWLHWEATIVRLFFDVEVTLYDVVDNRLLRGYRAWVAELAAHVDDWFGHLDRARRDRARDLARRAAQVGSFDELYELMGFDHVLDATGMLHGIPEAAYALVVSSDVLEHVAEDTLPRYLPLMRERLRPGGWSIHQIDLVDHFHYFDPAASPKNYYRYPDRAWRRWFESDVQYFNRVQRPTWLALFDQAGFDLTDEQVLSGPVAPLRIAPRYRGLSRDDLECMQLIVTHRRPTG